ncbi:MAG: porin family protein [Bacteroidota bacterium]
MKTNVISWIVRMSILCSLMIMNMSCAAILAEAGISCPSGSESSTYSVGEGDFSTAHRKVGNGVSRNANNNGRESKMFISYRAGARAVWPVADKVSVSSGLFLAGKGAKFEDETFDIEEKTTFTYIDVPARVHYEIGDTGININAGVQPSLLVGARNKVTINGTETETTGTDNYNTFDIAIGGGVGYMFDGGIQISLGYDHGLSNVINNDQFGGFELKNRVLHLSLGYQFN